MNYPRVIWWVVFSLAFLERASGQGFVNLDFESTTLASGGPPATVSASSAFPGWSVFIGTNAQSSVLYNNATLGASSVALLAGGSYSPVQVFDGSFSALLVAGISGNPSLTQTGLVPASAKSLQLYADFGPQGGTSYFSVSLNGQSIQMAALQPFSSYSYILYGGDISQFAGQVATLQITSLYRGGGGVNPFALDDIQFSPSSVPEPSVLSLLGLSLFVFYLKNQRPNTALEATPHSRRGFASEVLDSRESPVRGASAFVR